MPTERRRRDQAVAAFDAAAVEAYLEMSRTNMRDMIALGLPER
jgi:hypothetical protein